VGTRATKFSLCLAGVHDPRTGGSDAGTDPEEASHGIYIFPLTFRLPPLY